jgi:exodeoxyribonuclease-3
MPLKKTKLRIFTWNVNGIRAVSKKGFIEWIEKESPDILCIQETKAQFEQLDESLTKMKDYHCHFVSAEKKGYSGVATYSKIPFESFCLGCDMPEYDVEGRVLETEFKDFTLFNIYFPNGGRGPHRVAYKLKFYDDVFFRIEKVRKKKKNVIVCGDFNTAHKEIDLAKPEQWSRISGFLPEEREWIDKLINLGYVDAFRKFNKEPGQYTYWDQMRGARQRNAGWRIDYFFVNEEMMNQVAGCKIHSEVLGSDHCPVELVVSF